MEIGEEPNLRNPIISSYWTTNFIHIDGNWSATAFTYDWCNGDGSWENPYIIENVTIDASSSPTGSGIYIKNSKNDYFIIKNCTAYNSGTDYYDGGIKLENTNNGTLINNNCSNNAGCGIVMILGCENNTLRGNTANENSYNGIRLNDFCSNNFILDNTIYNNQYQGVYITEYCDYNDISGNIINDNHDDGIHLDSSSYNTFFGNTITNNNGAGIFIHRCNHNTISGNTVNYNTGPGIYLSNGNPLNNDHHNVSENTINYNNVGITLYVSNLNMIYQNTANDNPNFGMTLYDSDNNTILENNFNHSDYGIYLSECEYNNISGNMVNNHRTYGILFDSCYNNTLMENTLYNNFNGIFLEYSDDNSLVGNTANSNGWNGIHIYESYNNSLLGNTANNNHNRGIYLFHFCDGNNIVGNILNDNWLFGIDLSDDCDNNILLGNTAYNNTDHGIHLEAHCDNNTISGNYLLNNTGLGCFINNLCNDNLVYLNNFIGNKYNARDDGTNNRWDNGTIGNFWDDFTGIDANDDGIGDTPYDLLPIGGSMDNFPIWDDGPHVITIISPKFGDAYGTIAPSFNVSINFPVLDTSWYTVNNDITKYIFNGSSGTINQTAWDGCEDGIVLIRFFVNNTVGNSSSTEVFVFKDTKIPIINIIFPINNSIFRESPPVYYLSIEEVNLNVTWYTMDGGITNITFTELTGIINQTLWEAIPNGQVTIRFYARDVAGRINYGDVFVIKNVPYHLLYVEIIDQSFSKDEFNITFYIFDENAQGITPNIIQMWWNGTDVSDDVQNLGNGYFFVSLNPITVGPGDDPILLSMIISADGYEEKSFETYITVDPATLEKEAGGREEFPLVIIITISSTIGAIGATVISIGIWRKRRSPKKMK